MLLETRLMVDTETGPGVFETALGYTDASRMADNAALFKLVAKSVGMKHGILPTFMAKPWGDVSRDVVQTDETASWLLRVRWTYRTLLTAVTSTSLSALQTVRTHSP